MRTRTRLQVLYSCVFPLVTFLLFVPEACAHTEWTDYSMEQVNGQVTADIQRVETLIANLVLSEKAPDTWPTAGMQSLARELKELQEQVQDMINHLAGDGIDVQSREQLMANPRAGRAVAAGDALQTCIDLLDHAGSLGSREALGRELDSDGLAAYMYDLLDTQDLTMRLYGRLAQSTAAH